MPLNGKRGHLIFIGRNCWTASEELCIRNPSPPEVRKQKNLETQEDEN